jgi:hypothetical protein
LPACQAQAEEHCVQHGPGENRQHQLVPGFEFSAGRGLRRRKEISPT